MCWISYTHRNFPACSSWLQPLQLLPKACSCQVSNPTHCRPQQGLQLHSLQPHPQLLLVLLLLVVLIQTPA
jgi:hypothetical protein